jgi:release factor glutamine methyltransferase
LITIAEAIREGARRLAESGLTEEVRTSGSLLRHLLGVDRTQILTRSNEQIPAETYQTFLELVARRGRGEPLQYITGHQEFYGLDFVVTPDVLIPRPETEFLVEKVIALTKEIPRSTQPFIVDVGTGSGCIAVTLATHLPSSKFLATDISRAALEVARRNAELHGVEQRIEFVEGDLLEPLKTRELQDAVDIIASNPPYVVEGRPEFVQREVLDWEPHLALFGGPDGLDFYRRLLSGIGQYLKRGGFAVIEIGYSQLSDISGLVSSSSLDLVEVTRDLQGIPRTLSLQRPSL